VPALFAALALVWGSSFLFIKIGLDEGLPPFALVSYRLWIATLFLAIVLRPSGGRLPGNRDGIRRLAILGVINVAVPFLLLTWGEQYTSSAIASIFNALVPLFTIVIAAMILHDEPITLNRLAGLLVGFAGAVLLASPNFGVGGSGDATLSLVGEAAIAGAALSYACGAVYSRHSITGRALILDPVRGPRTPSPVEIALPQVATAAVLTTLVSLVAEHPAGSGFVNAPSSAAAWFAVSWLGILGSGVAYMLYFRIIRAWGATRSTLVTYVMPIVGITLGVLVLSERLHPAEIAGTVLILFGLVLANSRVGQRRLFGRAQAPGPAGAARSEPVAVAAQERLAPAGAEKAAQPRR